MSPDPALAILIPAAGRSRRMGRSKSLLPLGDRTVLQQVLTALQAAAPARVLVVLGPEGQPVADSLADWPVTIVWNTAPASEMADSLRTALKALPFADHGVLICLGDQPLIRPATFRRLAEEHMASPEALLQPCHQGKKGHPVLLPSAVLRELGSQPTLRDLLAVHAERLRLIEVNDPGILMDLDTAEDYRRALEIWQSGSD